MFNEGNVILFETDLIHSNLSVDDEKESKLAIFLLKMIVLIEDHLKIFDILNNTFEKAALSF